MNSLDKKHPPEQTDIVVFVRANHACADQVETACYSSPVFDDVCSTVGTLII